MKYLIFIVAIISCMSCRTAYQVTETKSTNVKIYEDDNTFKYEDDNLSILYNFWSEKGTLTFTIYNKTSKPIYFDWSHSNFIWNGYSIDYQKDVEITNGIGASTILSNGTASQGFSIRTKEKPQTQLPPNSHIVVRKFNIDMPIIKFTPSENNNKELSYQQSNSFFKFRNYIAYTFDKDMKELKFIDNDFWVSNIVEISKKRFYRNDFRNAHIKQNKFYNITKGERNKIQYGNNIIALNATNYSLWNTFSASYERFIIKNISFKIPLYSGYKKNISLSALDVNYFGLFPQTYPQRPKQSYFEYGDFKINGGFVAGLHLKYYPTGRGRIRGFIDLGLESGKFNIEESYYYTPQPTTTISDATYFGQAGSLGLLFQPFKYFNVSSELGISYGSYTYKSERKPIDGKQLPIRFEINLGLCF